MTRQDILDELKTDEDRAKAIVEMDRLKITDDAVALMRIAWFGGEQNVIHGEDTREKFAKWMAYELTHIDPFWYYR